MESLHCWNLVHDCLLHFHARLTSHRARKNNCMWLPRWQHFFLDLLDFFLLLSITFVFIFNTIFIKHVH